MKPTAIFTALFMLTACVPAAEKLCVAGKPYTETKFYFGLNRPQGTVSAKEWQKFVDTDISPRFPEGFTVLDAHGAWLNRETNHTISENSKVVIRMHDTDQEKAFREIVENYKRKFQQEAVMRVDTNVCAAF